MYLLNNGCAHALAKCSVAAMHAK